VILLVLSSKLLQMELEMDMILLHQGIMFMAPASYSGGPESTRGPVICYLDKFFAKKLSSGIFYLFIYFILFSICVVTSCNNGFVQIYTNKMQFN
jgi:hypothetical protein